MESANPQTLSDQAVALHRQGNLAQAEPLYLQALALDPAAVTPLHLLGLIRYQQARYPEALTLIGEALKIEPDFPEALSNYGLVLKALGRLDEALVQLEKALAIKPGMAEGLNNRGIILSDLNRLEEALASYDSALAIRADFAEAWSNRGLALQYMGKLKEARESLNQSLTLDPARAKIYLDYADVAPVAPDDPHLAVMAEMRLNKPGLSDSDRMFLDFALAKSYEDLKERERSFAHLLSANALKRAQIQYDEATALDFFERIKAGFPASLLREKENLGGGDPSTTPIFILGMMRSGSTLVEQILASHPQIHGGGELAHLSDVVNKVALPPQAPLSYPEFAGRLDAPAMAGIAAQYLTRLRALAPAAPHITDKMLPNFYYAGLIHLALPQARIIHTLRDPVDNCISCFSKLFIDDQNHTYDLAELGRYYRAYEKLMIHWNSVLPPGRMLEVRYEELVGDLEGQARRIIAHCGLEWDARCLSFHTTERPVRTASVSQVRQPIYRHAMGRARVYGAFLGPLKTALETP
jgi:tetratricopeptide (TPR) repeat protein